MHAKIDKAIRELEELIKHNEAVIEKARLLLEQIKRENSGGGKPKQLAPTVL